MSPQAIQKRMNRDQSGPARELTTQQQIDLLTTEIAKKQSSIAYYESQGLTALVESIRALVVRKVAERAKLKAQLDAETAEQERILKNITAEAQQEWLEDGNEVEVAK
jgi:hypothetical protein